MRKSKQVQWSRVTRDSSGAERGKGLLLPVEGRKAMFEARPMKFPAPKAAPHSEPPTSKTRGGSASRKRNVRGRSQSEKCNRLPCKYFLNGTCTKSPCECWYPPECQFQCLGRDVNSAQSAYSLTGRLKSHRTKSRKKGDDKSAVAVVKSVRQLSCVSQDTEPPDSATISRKGTKVLEPIRRVRFTRAALRQANIPEIQGPSLGEIQVKVAHQRSPCALKCEDRSPEKTAGQERCARGDAWTLAKNIFQLKKRKTKLHSIRLKRSGCWMPHPQQKPRKESLWRTPEQACTWSTRKTLTKPNWKPEDIEKSDDGGDSQRRSAGKRRGNGIRPTQKYTDSSFTWKTLRRTWV